MVLPGETTGGALSTKCSECGRDLPLKVCSSGAGHYLGYFCPECGPYSRESGYMSAEQAEIELAIMMGGEPSGTLRGREGEPMKKKCCAHCGNWFEYFITFCPECGY